MQLFAVSFIPLSGSLYVFRMLYTPIIRSRIWTVSTASGTNHSIVSATFFQRGLPLLGYSTCFGRFTHPSSGVQFDHSRHVHSVYYTW